MKEKPGDAGFFLPPAFGAAKGRAGEGVALVVDGVEPLPSMARHYQIKQRRAQERSQAGGTGLPTD